MRLAIAADHAAVRLKDVLAEWSRGEGHGVFDLGTHGSARVDHPDYGHARALALGTRLIGDDTAKACVTAFLAEPFEGGRHQHRIDKLAGVPA